MFIIMRKDLGCFPLSYISVQNYVQKFEVLNSVIPHFHWNSGCGQKISQIKVFQNVNVGGNLQFQNVIYLEPSNLLS